MKGYRFALFSLDWLFYDGTDSRYTGKVSPSVLFVVEWILIWALSLDAEKQLFRLLRSNVVLVVCACDSCSWRSVKPGSVTRESSTVNCKC